MKMKPDGIILKHAETRGTWTLKSSGSEGGREEQTNKNSWGCPGVWGNCAREKDNKAHSNSIVTEMQNHLNLCGSEKVVHQVNDEMRDWQAWRKHEMADHQRHVG